MNVVTNLFIINMFHLSSTSASICERSTTLHQEPVLQATMNLFLAVVREEHKRSVVLGSWMVHGPFERSHLWPACQAPPSFCHIKPPGDAEVYWATLKHEVEGRGDLKLSAFWMRMKVGHLEQDVIG